MLTSEQSHTAPAAHVPSPPSEARAWLLAGAIALVGVAVLVAVLTGALDSSGAQARQPPPLVLVAPTPVAGAQAATSALDALKSGGAGTRALGGAGAAADGPASATGEVARPPVRVSERWMEGFYPIYATAQRDVRRQLAAARVDPHAGDGLLDRAGHLPRPELRRTAAAGRCSST